MTTDTQLTLTADDVRAIRQSTDWSLHLKAGTAQLRVTRKLSRKVLGAFAREFGQHEVHREIPAYTHQNITAYFGQMYPTGAWQAVQALARAGDVLIFSATTNNNQYMDAAEIPAGKLDSREPYAALYVDECRVTLARAQKTILRDLLLTYSICPDNTARAIRDGKVRTYSIA